MTKEEEIDILRTLISQHMANNNYFLASRYLSLIEDIDNDRDSWGCPAS